MGPMNFIEFLLKGYEYVKARIPADKVTIYEYFIDKAFESDSSRK